jgi:hypothetical protein
LEPLGGFSHAACEKTDIETQITSLEVHFFLRSGQQIQEKRRQATLLENTSDVAIAAAVPATAAAVRKENDTPCFRRDYKVSR